ncbi:MAG: hypothetical protein AAF399_22490 [Bacteroidota bacterium]
MRISLSLLWWCLILGIVVQPRPILAQTDTLSWDLIQELSIQPGAQQIQVDTEGNIFLLYPEKSRLEKHLILAEYDSSIFIGGKSNRQEGFLRPTKIAIANRQSVFVLDEALKRISQVNTNLQVIQEMNFLDFETDLQNSGTDLRMYPRDMSINPTGEAFLLNDFDNKIIKINPFGEIEVVFAGLDFGEGSLYEPVQLLATENRLVFVSDTSEQALKVFDAFGVYRYTLEPETSFRWARVAIGQQKIFCFSPRQLFIQHLASGTQQEFYLPRDFRLMDLAIQGERIYLLGENEVHLYRFLP